MRAVIATALLAVGCQLSAVGFLNPALAVDGQGEDYDQVEPGSQDVPVNHLETTLTENDREEAHTPVAPDLAVSSGNGDECQGSFSVGAQVVFAGVSGGATVDIPDCFGLRSARLLFDMSSRIPGLEYASVGVVCQLNGGRNVGPINAALKSRGMDCDTLSGGTAPKPDEVAERTVAAAVQMAAAKPRVLYGSNR